MGLIAFVERKKISSLEIDVILQENYDLAASVTQYPVEDGNVIQDNVQLAPLSISLECFVSNTPLSGDLGGNRALETYQELKRLRDSRNPVDIVTGLTKFSSMVITGISIPRNSRNGQGLSFNVSLVQIQTAKSQFAQLAVIAPGIKPAQPSPQPTTNLGKTQSKPATTVPVTTTTLKTLHSPQK